MEARVELFQFLMTEHRHVVKRRPTPSTSTPARLTSKVYVPTPPNVSIENHRSKALNKAYQGHHRRDYARSDNDSVARPSLTITMPYLNQQSEMAQNSVPLSARTRHAPQQPLACDAVVSAQTALA